MEIEVLKKLGFTEYEAKTYLALAKLKIASISEIAAVSKVPRNKVYEALKKLEEKGKVVSLPISPRKYKINDIETLREDVKDLSKKVSDLIKKVKRKSNVDEFKELFWIIKGKKNIIEKLAIQNTKTEKEILACNRLTRIIPKNIAIMRKAIERGVKVKIICEFDKKNIEVYKEWIKTGAKIRVFNKKLFGPLLPRITIFDGKVARFTIGKPEIQNEDNYITLWTESKAFAQMLRKHFMNMWKKCLPIEKFISNKKT